MKKELLKGGDNVFGIRQEKSPCESKGSTNVNMVKWLFSNPYKFSDTENGRQIQKWLWVLIPLSAINIIICLVKTLQLIQLLTK